MSRYSILLDPHIAHWRNAATYARKWFLTWRSLLFWHWTCVIVFYDFTWCSRHLLSVEARLSNLVDVVQNLIIHINPVHSFRLGYVWSWESSLLQKDREAAEAAKTSEPVSQKSGNADDSPKRISGSSSARMFSSFFFFFFSQFGRQKWLVARGDSVAWSLLVPLKLSCCVISCAKKAMKQIQNCMSTVFLAHGKDE